MIGGAVGLTMVLTGAAFVHFGRHSAVPSPVRPSHTSGAPTAGVRPSTPPDARHDPSPAGARATAIAYSALVQTQVIYLGDAATDRLLRTWMAPGVNPAELTSTEAGLSAARQALLADGGQVWWVVSPLAAKVAADDGTRAVVDIWLVRVIASSQGYVPTSSWSTATVELAWTAGTGWSVWSVSDTPGPVPQVTTTMGAATSAGFASALNGFSLVGGQS
jgi:hypothetical protein